MKHVMEIEDADWIHLRTMLSKAYLSDGSQIDLDLIPNGFLNPPTLKVIIVPPQTWNQYAVVSNPVSMNNTPGGVLPWVHMPSSSSVYHGTISTQPIVKPDPTPPSVEEPKKKEIDYSKITKSLSGK